MEIKMNSNGKAIGIKGRKGILSTLWVFATLNYLYCDVIALMDSGYLKQILTGQTGSIQITQGFLLGAAILMEIPIAMVLLARVLKDRASRWVNIIAGTIMTVVQTLSLFLGTPTLYYAFFSTIEIACTIFIVWYAWKWKPVLKPDISRNIADN
jgi:hypothetical protein